MKTQLTVNIFDTLETLAGHEVIWGEVMQTIIVDNYAVIERIYDFSYDVTVDDMDINYQDTLITSASRKVSEITKELHTLDLPAVDLAELKSKLTK